MRSLADNCFIPYGVMQGRTQPHLNTAYTPMLGYQCFNGHCVKTEQKPLITDMFYTIQHFRKISQWH